MFLRLRRAKLSTCLRTGSHVTDLSSRQGSRKVHVLVLAGFLDGNYPRSQISFSLHLLEGCLKPTPRRYFRLVLVLFALA
jgi:hypothetical protein